MIEKKLKIIFKHVLAIKNRMRAYCPRKVVDLFQVEMKAAVSSMILSPSHFFIRRDNHLYCSNKLARISNPAKLK